MQDVVLERDVIGRDGKKVGTVDKMIVDPQTLQVAGFIVQEGTLFHHDRIVEEEFVDRTDADGNIILKITAAEEEQLPELATRRVVEPDEGTLDRLSGMHQMAMPSAAGRVLVMSEPVDTRFAPAPDSPLQPAPADPPLITDESNLPPDTITLEEGTDVLGLGGEKIGKISELIYDKASDQLEALVVEHGIIRKHHVRVPATWVESASHEAIRLTRSADEVKGLEKVN